MASKISPLLESYLSLPSETSQLVLTGILGASTNWLVLRFLYSFLKQQQHPAGANNRSRDVPTDGIPGDDVKVVFVSFMRDYAFWKDGAGRLVSSWTGAFTSTLTTPNTLAFPYLFGSTTLYLHYI